MMFEEQLQRAEQDNVDAQYDLGSRHYNLCFNEKAPEDTTQHQIDAYVWLSIAIWNGDDRGEKQLEHLKTVMSDETLLAAKEIAKKRWQIMKEK